MDRLPTDNLERALIEIDLFRLSFRTKVKKIKNREADVTLANSNWSPLTAIAHHIMSCHYSKILAAIELHYTESQALVLISSRS